MNRAQKTKAVKAKLLHLNRALLVLVFMLGLLGIKSAVVAAKNSQNYQQLLKSQTDNMYGAPRSGRNPAFQQQTSLASAASQPVGNGRWTQKPASAIKGTSKQVNPKTVLPDTKKTGVLSNGCSVLFGVSADQCVGSNTNTTDTHANH